MVLKQLADQLKSTLRTTVDVPVRYGGEEFAIILLKTIRQNAVVVAERLRKELAENGSTLESRVKVPLTVSIGVSACPEHTDDKKTLIRYPDEALYEAKRSGRNRVMVASPSCGLN